MIVRGRRYDEDACGDCAVRLFAPDGSGPGAALFKVLADRTHCRPTVAINEAWGPCLCGMTAVVVVSESNASQQRRANRLKRARRAGRAVGCSQDDEHVRPSLDTTHEHVQHQPSRSREIRS